MSEQETKTAFAKEWLKTPDDPFGAALIVCNHDKSMALQIAHLWPKDSFVLAEKKRLSNEKDNLPGKFQQALEVHAIAVDNKIDPRERIAAHTLYAKIMGHVSEENKAATQAVQVNVMVVKDHGTDNDWEARATAQQQKLIQGNASSVN
jgi:hypothetical protein